MQITCNIITDRRHKNDDRQRKTELDITFETVPFIGILLPLTARLLPTFNNRKEQDIKDIIEDFQSTYQILSGIARARKGAATTLYNELVCLKEMRQLIGEEKDGTSTLKPIDLMYNGHDENK